MKVVFNYAGATLLGALALAFVACGTPFPQPVDADVAWAKTRYPTATLASLGQGRKLFLGRCAGCHVLPEPTSHAPDKWPASVKGMADEAKLTEAEEIYIAAYLPPGGGGGPPRGRGGAPVGGGPGPAGPPGVGINCFGLLFFALFFCCAL
jgi:hypothetical protein